MAENGAENSTFVTQDDEVDQDLARKMSEMNKNMPIMVGRHERADRVLLMKHAVVYMYTLVDVNPQLVNVGKFAEALRPRLINAVCTTPLIKDFRDNKISVSYDYHWEDGSEVTMITVVPEDCARHRA